ncbi:hypothetical protein L7F22_039336 [Adiantum nelumboides]|nr:hypothetical protein [Adiantum nelumboides]
MRRKANKSLPPLNTKTSFCREDRVRTESQTHTPTLRFPPYPQSPPIDRTKFKHIESYGGPGGIRSFDVSDTVKSPPNRNLRHVRSAITTNDISEPILIEKKKYSADDPFHAAQETKIASKPISAPQSPRLFNFNSHSLAKEDGKRNQDSHSTKTKLHQRGRTDPSVSTSTIKSRNMLVPKRWSALFSSKSINNLQTSHPTYPTTQTHFKKFGKASSPKPDEALHHRLTEGPHEISHPFSVSAATGSALVKTITSTSNYVSMSPVVSSNSVLIEPFVHDDTEQVQFKLDLNARTPVCNSTQSLTKDRTPQHRQRNSVIGTHDHLYQHTPFSARSSGRYTAFHEPIEDVLEEYLLQDEDEEQETKHEQKERIRASFSEGNSLYYTPGENSMISESQSFATCFTTMEGRALSERSASTPALTQDGDRSAASSKTNVSDAHHMRDSSSHTLGSVRSNDSTIEDWGSRPEGLCIETGDEISTKLKAMLTDQGERNRQSRLRAWREHARSGSHREAALQTLLAHQKQHHHEYIDTPIQPAYHRVRVSDFLHIRGEASVMTDLQRYLQASGSNSKEEQENNSTSDVMEDDYGSTYRDSTMDATSILENDSESVEIRTAWRGKVDQYKRLENGQGLRTTYSTESFDMPKSEGKLIPSDSSHSPVLRPSNIPRRKHPKKPSLLQLNEADENQNYTREASKPPRTPKNPNRAATCTMGVPSDARYLPKSDSNTTLLDETKDFDLCAHLLQRARESRNDIN